MHPKAEGDTAPWSRASPLLSAPAGGARQPARPSPRQSRRVPKKLRAWAPNSAPRAHPLRHRRAVTPFRKPPLRAQNLPARLAQKTELELSGLAWLRPGSGPRLELPPHHRGAQAQAPRSADPPAPALPTFHPTLAAASCQQGQASRAAAPPRAFRPPQTQVPGAVHPRPSLRGRDQGPGHKLHPQSKQLQSRLLRSGSAGLPMRSPPRVRANLQSPGGYDTSALARRLSFSPQRLRRVAAAAAAAQGAPVRMRLRASP